MIVNIVKNGLYLLMSCFNIHEVADSVIILGFEPNLHIY